MAKFFQHILVATDFSEASKEALDAAVGLAREAAHLHVVHVCEVPPYGDFAASVDLLTPLTEAAEERLGTLVASLRAAVPDAKSVVKIGVPWEQIIATAAEVHADLIVLGTHGRRGFAHALLGSVAERVVQLSTIPVLTVRGTEPGERDKSA